MCLCGESFFLPPFSCARGRWRLDKTTALRTTATPAASSAGVRSAISRRATKCRAGALVVVTRFGLDLSRVGPEHACDDDDEAAVAAAAAGTHDDERTAAGHCPIEVGAATARGGDGAEGGAAAERWCDAHETSTGAATVATLSRPRAAVGPPAFDLVAELSCDFQRCYGETVLVYRRR